MRIEAVASTDGVVRDIFSTLKTSERFRRHVVSRGSILVNGTPARLATPVSRGDCITLTWSEEPLAVIGSLVDVPDPEIIYEDEQIIVCLKPAGISMQPSRKHAGDSLAYRLEKHYREEQVITGMHLVTRLDYSTSGLVLVARDAYVHEALQEKDVLSKSYLAVVEGAPSEEDGVIDKPIGHPQAWSIKRAIMLDGQPARTHYQVLASKGGYSLILATLLTGRTHQIRIHFASIGHPLAGDALYNPSVGSHEDHLKLHAAYLGITSTRLKIQQEFTSLPLWSEEFMPKEVLLQKICNKKG